ncbi:hypothetical protein [Tunturiibacter lichenicola]|uniref:hypothetical protein n=1 Tax=Tunturiibacter lichenicola TaxID=2051959 RepID=UPI0021B3EAFB|nr:hypothetical protein [Edaphobacter lichenicola]
MALASVIAISLISASTEIGFAARVASWANAQEQPQTTASQTGSTAVPVAAPPGNSEVEERPLPDIPTLMRAVETNQRASEKIEKDYLYKSVQTERQSDGHGGVKKVEVKEYDVFWVEGVPVRRMTKKNGKELTAEEQKKENEEIDKEVAKAKERRAKADAKGKESSPRGDDEITVSRLLELGSFTNARRVQMNGRDTIAIDFAGDPKAKTRNRGEDVIRDLVGTAWVDEQDKVLVKVQGHFLNNFKIGAGLVANIQKGTSFGMEQRKVNDEVWLPAMIEGQGSARALLFFSFNGSLQAVESDYRKFKATSTILPGMSTAQEEPTPQ